MEQQEKKSGEIYLAEPEKVEQIKKGRKIPEAVVLIAFIAIITVILFMLARPFLTGYITKESTYIDALNIKISDSQEYNWKPENSGIISSLRVSGDVEGKGNARVYIKDGENSYLIYDSEKGKSLASVLTGFVLEPTQEEQLKSEQALSEQLPEQVPAEQSPEQPAEKPAEQNGEQVPSEQLPAETPAEQTPVEAPVEEQVPSEQVSENITEEKPIENITEKEETKKEKFDDICDETCILELNQTEYTLVLEVDPDTELNLKKIIYTIKKTEEEALIKGNITEEIIIPAENITKNITFANITEIQYENIQEDFEIQAVIDSINYDNESRILNVIFHHESDEIQPISIISDEILDYSLSANESAANENVTLTIENWNPSDYFEIKIGSHSQIIGIGDIPEYDVNAEVKNADGEAVDVTVEFEKPVSKEIKNEIKGKAQSEKVQKGKYNLKITPEEGEIKDITINDVNINESIKNLISIDTNLSVEGYLQSYAIDPTVMNEFTSANVTAIAQGSELYKCKDWNFTEQTCFGEWIKIMDITPGQDYTFTLTPEDPAYGENATGTPNDGLAFFMSDSFGGGDRGIDGGAFDECPIQLNDYGNTSEKCLTWDCNGWTNGAVSTQGYYCSGGYQCTTFNGVTCAEYTCAGWTASGTNRVLKYCSGIWNCSSWNGNVCDNWQCSAWTAGAADNDYYCSGIWNCSSWNGNLCGGWQCSAWGAVPGKVDNYCSGLLDCSSWNENACGNWNCTARTSGPANKDAYCSGGWNCSSFNGNYCDNWQCNGWTASGTSEYDYYCDRWNCSNFDSVKSCTRWDCLQWLNSGANDKDAYCSGNWACTAWTLANDYQPPIISLVAPANGYTETNTQNVTFTYNVTDDSSISNCTFYLTDSNNEMTSYKNTTVTKNINQTFKINFDYNGNYMWNISCADSGNYQGWSENRNFTLNVPGVQANKMPSFSGNNFTIWESNVLTWNSGTLICSGVLNNNIQTTNCAGGNIIAGRTYRVQFSYNCSATGNCNIRKNEPKEYIDHIGVKGAGTIFGTNPALGSCGLNDFGTDDQTGASCGIRWNGNNIRMNDSGTGNIVVTAVVEGFMYNITLGNDAITNNTSYLNVSSQGGAQLSGNINLSVGGDNYPYWSNNQTSIAATYSPILSLFNITWQDDNGVSLAMFESNYSGSAANYTMSRISGNATNGVYHYNATLPAGTFFWKSYANDTANKWNSTTSWQFTINKAISSVNLTLNGTQGNIIISQGSIISLNCSLITPASGVIQLYNNGTLINSGSSPISNLTTFNTAGLYNITCIYPSTQNYSSSSETWHVNVTAIVDTTAPAITLINPQNNSLDSNGLVAFQYNVTDISAISSCKLIFNGIIDQTNNNVNKSQTQQFTKSGLGNGNYNWRINCTDAYSNQGASELRYFTVSLPQNYTNATIIVNETIRDSSGNPVSAKIEFIDAGSGEADYNATSGTSNNISSGTFNIKITPQNHTVKSILFVGANITGNVTDIIDLSTANGTGNWAGFIGINPLLKYNYSYINITITAQTKDLFKCPNWNFTTGTCIDGRWKKIASTTPGQNYTITMHNSSDPGFGGPIYTLLVLDREDYLEDYTENITDLGGDMKNVNITVYNHSVEKMYIYNHNASSYDNEIKIDMLDIGWDRTYALDPTSLSFSNATITANATGTALYKCKDWNFTEQNCEGSWIKTADLIQGQEYNFILNLSDPAYSENLQPNGTAGKDSYIDQQNPTINYGANPLMLVDSQATKVQKALIEFNLSYIPSNAQVTSAVLQLYLISAKNTNNLNISAYRINQSWTETGVTWNSRNGTAAWTTAGGDYASNAFSSTLVNSTGSWYSWNIKDLAQGWVNGTWQNYGIILTAPEGGGDAHKDFATSDNSNSSRWPILNISYSVDNAPNVALISPTNGYTSISRNVNFICNATDDIQLKNITFYWNYSGSFIANETIAVSGIYNQTTFSRTSLSNGAIKWNCLACDNASQCRFAPANYTVAVNYTIDTTSPTWNSNKTNANSSTKKGDSVYFNVTLNDNVAGGHYTFSYDNSSGFANDSVVSWISGQEVSVTKTITATRGQTVKWYFWFNDSSGNSNQTDIWSFTVANTPPIASNVDIKPDNPTTTDDLYCNYTYSDVDNDAESGTSFNWYKNNVLQNINSQILDNENTTKGENWKCQVTPKDSFDFGNSVNSSAVVIQNSAPNLTANIADQSWYSNANKTNAFDLDNYFSDADNDTLNYTYFGNVNITISINSNNLVSFSQPAAWIGTEYITFIANDSEAIAYSNNVTLTVTSAPAAPGPGPRRCTVNWQCSEWSSCINGTQKRTCMDLNKCGTVSGKPAESQLCAVIIPVIITPISIPAPPTLAPEITPEGFVRIIGEGIEAEMPKMLAVSILKDVQTSIKIKNTLDRPLKNVELAIDAPKPDIYPQQIHPYPKIGWSPAIATAIGGIGVKDTADYDSLLSWKITPVHYDSIAPGETVDIPLKMTPPAFNENTETIKLEILENGKVIAEYTMPVKLTYEKFFAFVDTKQKNIKDIFIGFDNTQEDKKEKVTIEFSINKGSSTISVEYLGPYTIEADSKFLLGQEYQIAERLAKQQDLTLKLKMFSKGKLIKETETAF